jgi:dolichol-phosphate mannosyltransferase
MTDTVASQIPGRDLWEVPEYDCLLWSGRKHVACVIIPVINEGERLANLLDRMRALGVHDMADIVVVDGGSRDDSVEATHLRSLGVVGLLVKRGPGRLSAQLRCGYAFALDHGYGGIVTIDGNNKDDPGAIPAFLQALQDGVDFVQASRFIPGGISENTPVLRTLGIRYMHAPLLALASGYRWTDTTQGFRAYSDRLLTDPRVAPFRRVFAGYELLAYLSYRAPKLGYKCMELPTSRRYPTGKVPTKIKSVSGWIELMGVLIKACVGRYNPTSAHAAPRP